MSTLRKDPLLAAAKGMLYFAIGVLGFTMVMILIGIGGVLTVGHDRVIASLAEMGAPASGYWLIPAAMLLVELLLFLSLRFALELRRIVLSVDHGDPFHPDNANRLSRMGWLTLGGWVTTLPLGVIAGWFARFSDSSDVQVEAGNINGLILTVVLFILARVFRHGAQMREELEGTV